MSQQKVVLKLTLIGPKNTGKSNLVNRFANESFNSQYTPTIGVDFKAKDFNLNRETSGTAPIRVQAWDTAGQEHYDTITAAYIRAGDAIGIVLAPDDKTKTVDAAEVKKYYESAKQHRKNNTTPIYFIINKTDLFPGLNEETIKDDITRQYPEIDRSAILFSSAKSNVGVDNVFNTMTGGALNSNPDLQKQSAAILPADFKAHSPAIQRLILLGVIANFIANHKPWAIGNTFLIVAAIVTLVTLATLPIGALPILAGITVLGAAAIAAGAAFLLWNVGCAVINKISGGGGGPDAEDNTAGFNPGGVSATNKSKKIISSLEEHTLSPSPLGGEQKEEQEQDDNPDSQTLRPGGGGTKIN